MIGTTFKTILFAGMTTVIITSIITATLLPFDTDAQAEIKYEPSDIKTAFEIADPFIIQDEHYILHFDVNAAQEKMSEFQIQIITDFVSLQNDYVNKVHDNPNEKPTFDEKLDEKFSKLKDGEWDLNKQIKEPNPEFLDYVSPVWWWTYYTAIWHQSGIGGEEAW